MKRLLLALLLVTALRAEPVPDKLVVLTFDDSVASHATFVAPLLKKHGFGATFFITEGFELRCCRRSKRHPCILTFQYLYKHLTLVS